MPDILKEYEAIGIIRPELGEQETAQLQQQFSEQVSRHGGRVLDCSSFGKRRLSFRLRKCSDGIYLQWRLQLPPGEVGNLVKAMGLMEPILRCMVTRKQEGSAPPRPVLITEGEGGEGFDGESQ